MFFLSLASTTCPHFSHLESYAWGATPSGPCQTAEQLRSDGGQDRSGGCLSKCRCIAMAYHHRPLPIGMINEWFWQSFLRGLKPPTGGVPWSCWDAWDFLLAGNNDQRFPLRTVSHCGSDVARLGRSSLRIWRWFFPEFKATQLNIPRYSMYGMLTNTYL